MDADPEQRPPTQTAPHDDQPSEHHSDNDVKIKSKSGERITLTSDDEDNDDIAAGFSSLNRPGQLSKKASNVQQAGGDSITSQSDLDREMLQGQIQQKLLNKFRVRNPVMAKAMEGGGPPSDDDDAEPNFGQGLGKKSSGKDDEAARFAKMKKTYLKKKAANSLTVEEEVDFLRAESTESARLRKSKIDESYMCQEASSEDEDEGMFVSEEEDNTKLFRDYEAGSRKKRSRKRQATEEGENEPPRKRNNQKATRGKGKKVNGTDNTDHDREDVSKKSQRQPSSKGGKRGKTKPKKDDPISNMANVSSLMGSNVFEDAARTANWAPQPTFGGTGRRDEALRQLVSSIPAEERGDARDDRNALEHSIKKFNRAEYGSIRAVEDGTWRVNGMKTALMHYQVQGVGFMRDRENSTSKPKGGILADTMGLGKTLEMLANIINGKPEKTKKHRSTLVVAAPAILTQWYNEISKHCHIDNTHKDGLGSVMQYRSAHMPKITNQEKMLLDNDIVLTTYHEVVNSFPREEVPDEITDPEEKEAWLKNNFEENKGLLHSVKFLRVCLDEGQAIKNHKSQTSRACRALKATHYWVMTGTPIMNTPLEFYPYFDLIREPAAGDYELYKKNFSDTEKGRERLNALLQKVMCRRTHMTKFLGAKLLDLPPPTEVTLWVQFNEIERKVYKIVETRFIDRINKIARDKELDKKYKHIWTMLLRLRQLCSHILLIQGTILDLLQRSDFEELIGLTSNENILSSDGAALVTSLGKILAAHKGVKTPGDHELGQNVIETETRPIDVVEFEAIEGEYGRSHGLSFRFEKYLNTLREKDQWEALMQRTLCCACEQKPWKPHVTSCYHLYCWPCLNDLQQHAARKGRDCAECSECGARYTSAEPCLGMEDFQIRGDTAPKSDDSEANASKKSDEGAGKVTDWLKIDGEVLPSAKTIATKSQVLQWLKEDRKTKILIFTQFLPMIEILAKVCSSEGWRYLEYTGKMSIKARDKALAEFAKNPKINILLASFQAGGLGLNLTMATRVINIDPWWNAALEQQAFCRVYRIGQQHPTQMTRFVVKNSVDARMQDLKDRKQTEIDEVLTTHQSKKRLSIPELLSLFGDVVDDDDETPFIHPKSD